MSSAGGSGGERPGIAVIVPCWNDGDFLLSTIGSLAREPGLETVVIDDGSTDPGTLETLEMLEAAGAGFGVRVLRQGTNQGVSAARNRGLNETSAPLVFPLDSDDLAVPGALAAMRQKLEATPRAGVCFGDYIEFGSRTVLRAVPGELDGFRLAFANEYPISALIRRQVLARAGGWERVVDAIDAHQDWDLWLSLAEGGERGVHLGSGRLTYCRRTHEGRLGDRGRSHHQIVLRMLAENHPGIFGDLAGYRRHSSLSPLKRLVFPHVYGARRRFRFERRVKSALDRTGIWTLTGELDEKQTARLAATLATAEAGAESIRAAAAEAATGG